MLVAEGVAAGPGAKAEGQVMPVVEGHGFEFADDFKDFPIGRHPLFDGGLISSEIRRERTELEKVKDEERAMRLSIMREVKDARLSIANAVDRIDTAKAAVESAREAVRIELLKYDTGAGTNTNVVDAQTALLRAETDSHQAVYDREVGLALLRKSMGEYSAEAGGF